MVIQIPLKCEMLVDQNRYIGDDPVGRKCPNDATSKLDITGHLICSECRNMLFNEPDRITIPRVVLGEEGQKELINNLVRTMFPKH